MSVFKSVSLLKRGGLYGGVVGLFEKGSVNIGMLSSPILKNKFGLSAYRNYVGRDTHTGGMRNLQTCPPTFLAEKLGEGIHTEGIRGRRSVDLRYISGFSGVNSTHVNRFPSVDLTHINNFSCLDSRYMNKFSSVNLECLDSSSLVDCLGVRRSRKGLHDSEYGVCMGSPSRYILGVHTLRPMNPLSEMREKWTFNPSGGVRTLSTMNSVFGMPEKLRPNYSAGVRALNTMNSAYGMCEKWRPHSSASVRTLNTMSSAYGMWEKWRPHFSAGVRTLSTMVDSGGIAVYKGIQSGVYTEQSNFVRVAPSFPILRCIHPDGYMCGDLSLPFSMSLSRELIQTMISLSVYDSILNDIQRQGRISFYMSSEGEEAASIGASLALDPNDVLLTQYREIGSLIWRGFTLENILSQCFGTHNDICKGRMMPMHFSDKKNKIGAISSPIATQIPQATGVGYALRLQAIQNCAVVFFGDGAASEGDFAVGLNIAKTLNSQTIFICRNNGFAISTPVEEQYSGDGIAIRGIAYGVPTLRVDGNDIVAVYLAIQHARQICIEEHTPVLCELMTYRLGNHSTSDDAKQYRNHTEVTQWKTQHPIIRFEKLLNNLGYWTTQESTQQRQHAKQYILKLIKEVEQEKKPNLNDGLFGDVYDNLTPHLIEQRSELQRFLEKYGHLYALDEYKDGHISNTVDV